MPRRRVDHPFGEVAHDDVALVAAETRGRKPCHPGAGCEVEDGLPSLRSELLEHGLRHRTWTSSKYAWRLSQPAAILSHAARLVRRNSVASIGDSQRYPITSRFPG
jgi:hypothetical protein